MHPIGEIVYKIGIVVRLRLFYLHEKAKRKKQKDQLGEMFVLLEVGMQNMF